MIYRIYVTEGLRMIAENTSKYAGGSYMEKKYYDIVSKQNEPEDTRTASEIIEDIITRAGIKIGGE